MGVGLKDGKGSKTVKLITEFSLEQSLHDWHHPREPATPSSSEYPDTGLEAAVKLNPVYFSVHDTSPG